MNNLMLYSYYCTIINLWGSVLCGRPTETQKTNYDFMKNPKPGDLVVENSSGFLAMKAWNDGKRSFD